MYTRSWECFVYALRRLLSEARIARTDDWFLYIDGESSAVGSSQCLAFIVLRGGEVLTSLPYAHLYIAENCVYRHSRIIWGILYQSGIGIAGWDDVTDTWWMFADYEVVSLFDAEGVVHTTDKWKPVHNEVIAAYLADQSIHYPEGDAESDPTKPKPFFGQEITVKLASAHPLVKYNKWSGVAGNYPARVTGVDGQTTAGVRIHIDAIEEGKAVLKNTVVPYDNCRFTGRQHRKPDDTLFLKHTEMLHPYDTHCIYGDDGVEQRWLQCRLCNKYRLTTVSHHNKVMAELPDQRFDRCQDIPMITLGIHVRYDCLYPEQLTQKEKRDLQMKIGNPGLPWYVVSKPEPTLDAEVEDDDGQVAQPNRRLLQPNTKKKPDGTPWECPACRGLHRAHSMVWGQCREAFNPDDEDDEEDEDDAPGDGPPGPLGGRPRGDRPLPPLRPGEFQPGVNVEIHGLQDEQFTHFNGKRGVITKIARGGTKWRVKIGDEIKMFLPIHMKVVEPDVRRGAPAAPAAKRRSAGPGGARPVRGSGEFQLAGPAELGLEPGDDAAEAPPVRPLGPDGRVQCTRDTRCTKPDGHIGGCNAPRGPRGGGDTYSRSWNTHLAKLEKDKKSKKNSTKEGGRSGDEPASSGPGDAAADPEDAVVDDAIFGLEEAVADVVPVAPVAPAAPTTYCYEGAFGWHCGNCGETVGDTDVCLECNVKIVYPEREGSGKQSKKNKQSSAKVATVRDLYYVDNIDIPDCWMTGECSQSSSSDDEICELDLGWKAGRAGVADDQGFFECYSSAGDLDAEFALRDYEDFLDECDLVDFVEVRDEGASDNETSAWSRSSLSSAVTHDLLVAAKSARTKLKHRNKRIRRRLAKGKEASGDTDDLIGYFDELSRNDKPLRSRIKLKKEKQKEAIRKLLDFQVSMGVPNDGKGFVDHQDPYIHEPCIDDAEFLQISNPDLASWAAKVTRTLTRKQAFDKGPNG